MSLQFLTWGAAWTGDVTEFGAMIAEGQDPLLVQAWDRQRADLAGLSYSDGSEWYPAPCWWALPWVTEYRMRREKKAA